MTNEAKILSFDVGVKNLAFCKTICSNNVIDIIDWEVIDLHGEKMEDIVLNCTSYLKTKFHSISGYTVLIERQYHKNIKAYVLSHVLHTFFLLKQQRVVFVNADIKPLSEHGQKRKRDAILKTQDIISDKWKSYLELHAKKDDLCDSFLNIVGYLQM